MIEFTGRAVYFFGKRLVRNPVNTVSSFSNMFISREKIRDEKFRIHGIVLACRKECKKRLLSYTTAPVAAESIKVNAGRSKNIRQYNIAKLIPNAMDQGTRTRRENAVGLK